MTKDMNLIQLSLLFFYVNQNFVLPFLRLRVLNFPLRMLETPLCSVSADSAKSVLYLHMHQLQICSTLMCLDHEFLVTAVVFMVFLY